MHRGELEAGGELELERAEVHGDGLLGVLDDGKDVLGRDILQPQDLAQRRAAVQIGQQLLPHTRILRHSRYTAQSLHSTAQHSTVIDS